MQKLIILQVIVQLFILNMYHLCYAAEKDISLIYQPYVINFNNLKDSQENKDKNIYYLETSTDKNNKNYFYYPKYIKKIKDVNNNIYEIYPKNINKQSLYMYRNNKNQDNFKIKIQNDSINLLHTFYDSYSKNFMYNRALYFSQFGIQDLFLENIITYGLGKKQFCSNQNIIGYNALIHIPIFSKTKRPYSMNFGGEFWHKGLMFSLNSYYNLNKIINFNKLLYPADMLLYPQIGYQVQCKIKLPYILECYSKINWEQCFYNKRNMNLFNQFQKKQTVFSIGVQYKPIPILEFNIDNAFMHKSIINTVFKVAFNYQFNIPIAEQIRYKKNYNKKQSILPNDLNTIIESFIPSPAYFITDITSETSKIIGYPGETKLIKFNQNYMSPWNSKFHCSDLLNIKYIKDNIYMIRLPKLYNFASSDTQDPMCITYTVQCDRHSDPIQKNIFVVIKDLAVLNVNSLNYQTDENSSSIIAENNTNESIFNNTKERNVLIHQDTSANNSNDDSINNTVILLEDKLCNKNSNTKDDNTNSNNDAIANIPPPPKLPVFSYNNQLSSSSNKDQGSCSTALDSDTLLASNNNYLTVSSSTEEPHTSAEKKINNFENNDFSRQLCIQKNTKFSSIGTQEYIEKLEKSILIRKKDKKMTDVEKIFNKLHIALSQSSIAESVDTNDDSIDSFD